MSETSAPQPRKRKEASEQEISTAFQGAAPYVNKTLLTLSPVTGRLSFLELPPGDGQPVFRAAVTMAIHDLLALRNLIDAMLPEESIQSLDLRKEQEHA